MQILSETTQTARKTHKCNFCCIAINPFEKYESKFIVDDGYPFTWKTHPSCSELADKLDMYSLCEEGVTEDDFFEIVCAKYRDITGKRYRDDGKSWPEALEFVKKHVLIP